MERAWYFQEYSIPIVYYFDRQKLTSMTLARKLGDSVDNPILPGRF